MKHFFLFVVCLLGTLDMYAQCSLSFAFEVEDPMPNSACNGSIDIIPMSGTPPFSYAWSNGATMQNLNNLCAGTYIVTGTDASGCFRRDTFVIGIPVPLAATVALLQGISCNGGANGKLVARASGGTPYTSGLPYRYRWFKRVGSTNTALNITDSIAPNLIAGSYLAEVTDAGGNLVNTTLFFLNEPTALAVQVTATNPTCFGSTNGSATAAVSGGTTPYSYNWSVAGSGNTASINNLAAGNYSVTVRDAAQCQSVKTFTITTPAAVDAALEIDDPTAPQVCNGSIDLTPMSGAPPFTYSWSNGATTQDLSNLCCGNYSVAMTDANGCTVTKTATLNCAVATLNAVIVHKQSILCNGGSNGQLVARGNGGTPFTTGAPYQYQWFKINGATATPIGQTDSVATNLSAGQYQVKITDATGATATSGNHTLAEPALLSVQVATTNPACFGSTNGSATATVSGGTAPYTYSWSATSSGNTASITNLSTGNYTVMVTDANSCVSTKPFTITNPAAVNAALEVENPTAPNVCDGAIDVTPMSGTPPFTYSWSNGATTQDISNLCCGTYSVTMTDAASCSVTKTATLVCAVAPLTATVALKQAISCNGGSNGSLAARASGGTPFTTGLSYHYQWFSVVNGTPTAIGQTDSVATGLTAGEYRARITDAAGTTVTASYNLAQPSAIAAQINTTNVSCAGGANGSATAVVSGGIAPYQYSWSVAGAGNTQTVSNLAAGNYTVTVTDARQCQRTQQVTITAPAAITTSVQATDPTGPQVCNGAIVLTVTGGTAPFTYSWSNGATTKDLNNLCCGTYTVTITDGAGCTASRTVILNCSISVTIVQKAAISCSGGTNGSLAARVSGGTPFPSGLPYQYQWFKIQNSTPTAIGQTDSVATGLAAGEYQVQITDAQGVIGAASFVLAQPTPLVAQLTAIPVSCFGGTNGSATAQVSGGTAPYTYSWSAAGSGNTATVNNLAAGTYTVTITDAAGCSTTRTVTITAPAALSATVQPTDPSAPNLCNGAINITPAGGTAPYAYSWSNGATTEDLGNICCGTYTVTITDARGCTLTRTATLNCVVSVTIALKQAVSCNGGNNGQLAARVNGGTPFPSGLPYQYQWFRLQSSTQTAIGQTDSVATGLTAGEYLVKIADAAGLNATSASFVLAEPALLTAQVATTNVSCFGGSNGSATATVNGGTAPYSYSWSVAGSANTSSLNNLAAGTYTVTITDARQCQVIRQFSIIAPAALAATAQASSPTLPGVCNGAIDMTVTGGTAPYSYSWSNGATTEDLNSLCCGTYTVIITDAAGCTASRTVTLSCAVSVSIVQKTPVSCFGSSSGSLAARVNGGTPFPGGLPFQYQWFRMVGSAFTAISQTDSVATSLAAGEYRVQITDAAGSTAISPSFILTAPAVLAAPITTTPVLCFGGATGTATVAATGGTAPYTYTWSVPGTGVTLTGLFAGNYTLTTTDARGCTASTSFSITQPTALQASGTIQQPQSVQNCNGGIQLTVSGGTAPYSYSWSNGATTPNLINICAGTYTVTITDANGCTRNLSFTVINQLLVSVAQQQVISCFGRADGALVAHATGGVALASGLPYQYQWFRVVGTALTALNQPDSVATGLSAGQYQVIITDAAGTSITSTLFTLAQPAALALQSATTPVSCFGGANGSASITATGGTAPYTYDWSIGATTAAITNVAAGSYFVFVKDARQCAVQAQVQVSSPAAIRVDSLIQQPYCFGSCNGAVQLMVSGGTAPYSYTWNNGSTAANLSALCAGTYIVTVRDANNCTTTKIYTLTNPAAYSINLGPDRSLCVGQSLQFNGAITDPAATYLWGGSNGFTATTAIATINAAGTYWVRATSSGGCVATDTIVIRQTTTSLKPEFVVSTQAFKGHTVTLVNISTPSPDSINWIIPNLPSITVQSTSKDKAELLFSDTGTYNLAMRAKIGECEMTYTQKVIVIEGQPFTNPGNTRDPFIRSFNVAPSPNTGQFTVHIELVEEAKIRLRLINVMTNAAVNDRQDNGHKQYTISYNVSVAPGIYMLLLETAKETRVFKVIIN